MAVGPAMAMPIAYATRGLEARDLEARSPQGGAGGFGGPGGRGGPTREHFGKYPSTSFSSLLLTSF